MVSRIKDYHLIEVIGKGGFATVYLASHVSSPEIQRAIKVLHPAHALDPTFRARFEDEAKNAASLRHKNLLTVHEWGYDDASQSHFIVMELMEADLRQILGELGPKPRLPQEVGLTVLEEVAWGLKALHERNLVHRDLKPANILLDHDGNVKLGDFGLVKRIMDPAITMPGSVLGTAYYMSPEQSIGKRDAEVDLRRSDFFSLGVIAYEILSGERPFQGESITEVLGKLTSYSPPRISALATYIHPDCADLIEKMLSKDPSRRPSSAEEISDTFREIRQSLPDYEAFERQKSRHIREFVADPVTSSNRLRKAAARRHRDRGDLYRSSSDERRGDAYHEYEIALSLDPDDVSSRERLVELKAQSLETVPHPTSLPVGESQQQTGHAAEQEAAPVVQAEPGNPSTESAPIKVAPVPKHWLWLGAAAAVLVALWIWLVRPPDVRYRLHIDSAPPGASISLRGPGQPGWTVLPDKTPAEMEIKVPGAWEARLDLENHVPFEGQAMITRRAPTALISASLEPVVTQATDSTHIQTEYTVKVQSDPPGAQIQYRKHGTSVWQSSPQTTPAKVIVPGPGAWELRLTLKNYRESRPDWVELTQASASASVSVALQHAIGGPHFWITVNSSPPGARVSRSRPGGAWQDSPEAAPCVLSVPAAGTWRIKMTLPGYQDYEATATIPTGDSTTTLTAALEPAFVSPKLGCVNLTVTPPDATIRLSRAGFPTQVLHGSSSSPLCKLDVGTWNLHVESNGYVTRDTLIVISSETTTTTRVSLPHSKLVDPHGYISLSVYPQARELWLDGQLNSRNPPRRLTLKVSPGPHELQVIWPDGRSHTWGNLTVSATDTLTLKHVTR